MKQIYSCGPVPFADLVDHGTWDIHPFLPENEPPLQPAYSLEHFGLLHPPLVRQIESGKYELVTGSRSVALLKGSNQPPNVICRILPADIQPQVLLSLLYLEYASCHPLSVMCAAYYFNICRNHLTRDVEQRHYNALNLPAGEQQIKRHLDLLNLELPLQAALHDGSLNENCARELLHLDRTARLAIFDLISELRLGGGKQRRAITLLRDLSGRQGISIAEYVMRDEIQAIISHKEMNTPQKAHAFLQLLQRQHTPSLEQAEKNFSSWQSSLSLPDNCTVSHSQSFESDAVTLSIEFADSDDLERGLVKIRDVIGKICKGGSDK